MVGRHSQVEYHVCFHHDTFNAEEKEDILKGVLRRETTIHRLKKMEIEQTRRHKLYKIMERKEKQRKRRFSPVHLSKTTGKPMKSRRKLFESG